MIQLRKLLAISVLTLIATHVYAEDAVNPMPVVNNDWRFSASINGWMPATFVTATAGNLSKSADSSIGDNIKNSGAFAFFTGEAHKGDWGLMADLVYSQMSGDTSKTKYIQNKYDIGNSLYAGLNTKTTSTILTVAGTYTAHQSESLYLDVLAGARYISSTSTVSATAKLTAAGYTLSASGNQSFTSQTTDAIVGFKGRARISDTAWFIPYYVDAGKGVGANNKTWQTILGVGKGYSWGDVTLTYRAMYFDLNSGVATTKILEAGPQLAATFNF
jgi:hypothetical protein